MEITCPICSTVKQVATGSYNRAIKQGNSLYCGKACAGIARRKEKKPLEQFKIDKAEYDRLYREKNKEARKIQKAIYYANNHDRTKEKEYRDKNMSRHVAYCARPEYREKFNAYCRERHHKKKYGEFYEAGMILAKLEKDLFSKEIKYDNGLINKKLKRRRIWNSLMQNR